MQDQAPDAEITTQGSADDGAPANDALSAALAEVERLKSIEARLRDDEKAERAKRQKAEDEARERMEAEGRFQALAEDQKARIAALEAERAELAEKLGAYAPKVERYDAWEAKQAERVSAALENGIPEYLKTALRATPDVVAQTEILDAYQAEQAGAAPKPASPSGGSQRASVDGGTVEDLLAQGKTMTEIKSQHPEAWAAFMGAQPSTSSSPGGSFYQAAMSRLHGRGK